MNDTNEDRLRFVRDEATGEGVWRRESTIPAKIVDPPKPRSIPTWFETRQRLLDVLYDLLRSEMEETSTDRFYIIPLEDMGVSFHGDFAGAAGRYLADSLRPVIGNDWNGIKPAMLLNVRGHQHPGQTSEEEFASLLLTSLHESIHWLQEFPSWAGSHPRMTHSVLETFVGEDPNPDTALVPFGRAMWHGHNWQFIRLMFHACSRVHERTKIVFPMDDLLAWSQCGYRRGGWQYMLYIQDEIQLLKYLPLSKIAALDPPKEFMNHWFEDTKVDHNDPVAMAGFLS